MSNERILFIRRDPVLNQARELPSRSLVFDEAKQVYAYCERKGRERGKVITYQLDEAFVDYDRSVDLKPRSAPNYYNPGTLKGLRN